MSKRLVAAALAALLPQASHATSHDATGHGGHGVPSAAQERNVAFLRDWLARRGH